ncbi:hypothetical protein Fmac_013768 [Flemingia macrophylla]|uniref:2-C-methyl-D-erythritol 4-phosphate cytidylyltransferase, chloroplastic n=1 Tax=Flemingia macrophylla TaxID=520843 RepID=A0ABD1MU31_9FABA
MRSIGGIEVVVELFADEVNSKGDEGDAETRGGVAELIGQHRMLPPFIPSPEELSRTTPPASKCFHSFTMRAYAICQASSSSSSSSSSSCITQKRELKANSANDVVRDSSVSVLLLAGGQGKRMGATMPKQYLPLLGQPIALYSFYTFSHMVEVKEIVVVCDPSYRDIFEGPLYAYCFSFFSKPSLCFLLINILFQLQICLFDPNSDLVCIHDSARPLVLSGDVRKVLKDGLLNGAAVLGVPLKATIKETNSESFVVKTLDRKTLWEMQTPQVIKPELLKKGFELVNREGLEVTDDVSIVEHLKHPVYVTEGSYTNIKVTTPDDMLLAERILNLNSGENIVLPIRL